MDDAPVRAIYDNETGKMRYLPVVGSAADMDSVISHFDMMQAQAYERYQDELLAARERLAHRLNEINDLRKNEFEKRKPHEDAD